MKINKDKQVKESGVSIMPHKKDKIILSNTNAPLNDHFTKLETRLNGNFDRAPAFTISATGVIYQHFDPSHYSNFMWDEKIDQSSIVISLENVGFLIKNETDSSYYDWRGNQYNGRIFEKSWRNKRYWAKYTNKQLNALIDLIKYLCIEYDIEQNFMGHNVSAHKPETFKGVLNRSNFYSHRYDLTPAIDFEFLTEQINNKNNEENE